jgi:endonuclease G
VLSKVYYLLAFFFISISCIIANNSGKQLSIFHSNRVNQELCFDSLYLPEIDSSEILICHYAYNLVYDESHEQAKWVFYKLDKSKLDGPISRTDNFKIDPLIVSGSAHHEDYRGSGFDRGHLAPAGDMTWSLKAMEESFYYSNMSPQKPSFNRGIWRKLETKTRKWVADFDSIYVTTGPIFDENMVSIGKGVSVPNFFYKALIGFRDSTSLGLAFVLPNEGSKDNLKDYVISIDSLERLTDIDFHSKLDISVQNQVEKTVCITCWKWQ